MNFAGYEYLLDGSSWAMDDLHIEILHGLIMEHRPKTVMEIGSYRGRSAIAYIEALKAGADFTLHLVEPNPRDSLLRLVDSCGFKNRIRMYTASSWEIQIPCDFVFIDGDHRWPAVADTLAAVALGSKVIAMHDTRAHEHGYRHVWGSYTAARLLEKMPGRQWHEDFDKRAGMRTERGLGWSIASV